MSPELRFVAQLARLARALEHAADRVEELDRDLLDGAVLESCAWDVRGIARARLDARVAERGSAKSAS